MNQPKSYIFKYIIIGDPSVGKSCILNQFINDTFTEEYDITVGVEFGAKNIVIKDGTKVKLQIWDTAGQENFKSVTRGYYRSSAVAIICYDITQEKTFESVNNWIQECRMNAFNKLTMVLVGNKTDLDNQRQVSFEQGRKFAKENGMFFVETSAKDGSNVKKIFEESANKVYEKLTSGEIDPSIEGCGVKENIIYQFQERIIPQQKVQREGCC